MCKADIFNEIIQIVQAGKRRLHPKSYCREARKRRSSMRVTCLVYFLFKEGFYPSQIASLVGKTKLGGKLYAV